MSAISQLNPQAVWQYFDQLTQIPRPSHYEEAVQQFILDEAKKLGLSAERDEVGNIVVRKPATQGKENVPGVILQSHLDMVAQKNQDTQHNFTQDPIKTLIEGDWVTAQGTTLGADNGIGAAAALAVLASKDISHGPIEALFTATEETGMEGAKGLKGGWLNGEILLNLDSEELGEICIGCAGGLDGDFSLPLAFQPNTAPGFALHIRGLKGGHSGIDIIRQRGNAIKILIRLLSTISDKVKISTLEGGNLRNAIPREADALFASEEDIQTLRNLIEKEAALIRHGLPKEDRQFVVQIESVSQPVQIWTQETQKTVLDILELCPNGVDRMSVEVPAIVETSSNLAKLTCKGSILSIHCLLRSSDSSAKNYLANNISRLFQLAGGSAKLSGNYDGWQPVNDAEITQIVAKEGEKLLGKKPHISIIHAGLECGLLNRHYPHWQMVSFGPTIEMPHSPDERVNIKSVDIFWQWLKNILETL
ncbi:aminoacyl-histidine dipeptidase [Suttonella ornithocola]|uniref:Cytosol non-specific dipeptidase n=1 Tax=Suttonella ornithocola TaxID=279832 RepID=A0A380MWB4_9GAMM|nr:aminoacyl-histidine dipeptidase [Suttonella ornithocola]SUO96859.1 Cytosol non-specific dipeptidase [Suttonella ornithocola]